MPRGSGKDDAAHADHVELVEAPELDEMMPEPEPVRAPVDNSQVAAQATQQREAQPEEPEMLRQRLFTGAAAPPPPPRKLREPGGDDEATPAAGGAPPPDDDEPGGGRVGQVIGRSAKGGPPPPVGPPASAARRTVPAGWGSPPRGDDE